ncbi:MAG TPA: hypothetical protein VGC39_10950 [Candidatus Methylacidiphilales bacterium]
MKTSGHDFNRITLVKQVVQCPHPAVHLLTSQVRGNHQIGVKLMASPNQLDKTPGYIIVFFGNQLLESNLLVQTSR